MIPVAVESWGCDEASKPLEELNRRKQELGASVRRGLGQPIDELGLRRAEGDDAAGGVEPLQGEGWTSTVPEQPFDACSVLTLDADGGVDAEATGALPGEHAVGIGLLEQAVAIEVAEHTLLDDVLEFVPMLGLQEGGFMEPGRPIGGL